MWSLCCTGKLSILVGNGADGAAALGVGFQGRRQGPTRTARPLDYIKSFPVVNEKQTDSVTSKISVSYLFENHLIHCNVMEHLMH